MKKSVKEAIEQAELEDEMSEYEDDEDDDDEEDYTIPDDDEDEDEDDDEDEDEEGDDEDEEGDDEDEEDDDDGGEDEEIIEKETPEDAPMPTKKKGPGRPKGSKNKKKGTTKKKAAPKAAKKPTTTKRRGRPRKSENKALVTRKKAVKATKRGRKTVDIGNNVAELVNKQVDKRLAVYEKKLNKLQALISKMSDVLGS